MEIYKLKFTQLQNEIFRVLCIKTGEKMSQRQIAKILKVSPTAVSKSIGHLEKEHLIKIDKNNFWRLENIEKYGKRIATRVRRLHIALGR